MNVIRILDVKIVERLITQVSAVTDREKYYKFRERTGEATKSKLTIVTTALFITCDSQHQSTSKTAVTALRYRNQETMANILLDEGAQNSFITVELAQKLNIVSNESITLKISAFGDGSSEVRHIQKATVQLETRN